MRKTLRRAIGGAILAAILATAARAQSPSWPTPPVPSPQAESPTAPQTKPASLISSAHLEQMLAPLALYPDELLADIFMAATYPLDVVEATRWLQNPQNATLKGDQLFAALQQKPWDPSVKSLAPFPRIMRMLDANLEWTERLGEAYLGDPGAVMDAVQRLRRRAQSAGRLVTTPREVVRTEQDPTRIEEFITIEAPSPEVVYVPICDPSFAYGPWPYTDYPPFLPAFAGAAIGGCGWIGSPILPPFWGVSVLNFHARHIEIDRKRLAFDRDRQRGRNLPLGEEWRHDPGHRGNVPYRDAAVVAAFGSGTPAANFNPAFRGGLTAPSRGEGPLAAQLSQQWRHPGMEARPTLDGGRAWPEGIRAPMEGGLSSTARVQPRFGSVRPALEGVDPIVRPVLGIGPQPFGSGGPGAVGARSLSAPHFGTVQQAIKGVDPDRDPGESVGQPLNRNAETRLMIERELMGRVSPTTLPTSLGGVRAFPSLGGAVSARSLDTRRSFRPLVDIGAQSFRGRGPAAIGAQPFIGRGPQLPPGGIGAGGGRGGG